MREEWDRSEWERNGRGIGWDRTGMERGGKGWNGKGMERIREW